MNLTVGLLLDLATLSLSKEDKDFLLKFDQPVLRKLLSSKEITIANRFVKMGLIEKGKSDDNSGLVIYYLDSWIKQRL